MVNGIKTKKKPFLSAFLALFIIFTFVSSVFAEDYSFQVPDVEVHVFLEPDGTIAIEYAFYFINNPGAHPIDFVDIGMPAASRYSLANVSANIDGIPITDIQSSPYIDGIALGLGNNAIQPGNSGTVYMYIDGVRDVFYFASTETSENFASLQFQPNYFAPEFTSGSTNMSVNIHLPPGAKDGEVIWYTPKGWPGEGTPASAIDDENRIFYQWYSSNASPSGIYTFGVAFPARLIPADAIRSDQTFTFNPSNRINLLIPIICGASIVLLFVVVVILFIKKGQKRKLDYLPPKIAIEGHGIKRGLTAVEAAILMEQPMDKILTLILFSVLKKGAATVINRNPLEIRVEDQPPQNLRDYEIAFLQAFKIDEPKRRKILQDMMVSLVKSVGEKMKGFSRKETIDYYKDIMEKAWQQVESAETPEVRAEKYSEAIDWTILDRDFDTRTRRTFGTGPVYMPYWWYRADPTLSRTSKGSVRTQAKSSPTPPSGGRSTTVTLPKLPGADAAASVINSVAAFSSGVVGNLATFTSAVTSETNPALRPSSSTSRSGGGRGIGGGSSCACACACACAGCACACAGGGR